MNELNLDEFLEARATEAVRPARFVPKGSKYKPRPKTDPSQPQQLSSDFDEFVSKSFDSIRVAKKEEHAIKHEFAVEMDIDGILPDEMAENEMKKEEAVDFMETEETKAEDEVVREIDVYLNPSLDPNTQLYVLQYPLRPLWRPYELEERCAEVRVKPSSAEMEIDLTIDFESKNYDRNADPRVLMKKQMLASPWMPCACRQTSSYAVGYIVGDKLHLNPVHAIVQLRPSMEHLTPKESKKKNATSVGETVKEEETEGKPLGASKKLNKPEEKDTESVEDWIPLKYHGTRSDMAAGYLHKMVAREGLPINFSMSSSDMAAGYLHKMVAREGLPINFSMSSDDYLNNMCPSISNDSNRSEGPSKRFLMTLPLKERLKKWLIEGPPIHRFDALKYLAPNESVEEIFEALQEHARLVQGLWVPKSSLVYGTDQGMEVLARDFVLLLFSKNVLISSSQLPKRPSLSKAMKDVLKILAVERPACSDWKLKELPDFKFMKLNSSLVKKQEEEWECLERKITTFLVGGINGQVIKASSKFNTENNQMDLKSSNKVSMRAPNVANPKTQMSAESREAIMKALQKLFKSVKVCSFQQISQRLRDMAVSESARSTGFAKEAVAAANSIDAYPTELQEIISQIAVNIHGVCVPKSSPDHPQYDAFRKVVINLFIAEGKNAKLKKAPIFEAAKLELKREITPLEYNQVLRELCASQGSAWVLRSGDGNPTH